MALPRVYSLGHAFVSRGSMRVCATAFSQSRIAHLSRPFVSTTSLRDTTAQDSSTASSSKPPPVSRDLTAEELRKKNGASIALFRVPGDVTPEALKEIFTSAGFDVVNLKIDMDRFRFRGSPFAQVQLANQKQVEKAMEVLQATDALGSRIFLRGMRSDYDWKHPEHMTGASYVDRDEAGARSAVQPIIDGRRVRISVQSPAWGAKKDTPKQNAVKGIAVLQRVFNEFGVEAISTPAPQFGHKTFHPKFYCHMDFTTREGAEAAMKAVHDTEVDGQRVWAVPSEIDPAKAYQIGRISKALLKELQENGLAPPDSDINEKMVSRKTKKDPLKFDRQRNAKAKLMWRKIIPEANDNAAATESGQ